MMRKEYPLNQYEAPIAHAMKEYAGDGALAFHTPGHKQGLGAHRLLRELITEEGLRQEVSLMEELDDLHEPEGCIKAAEALAAGLWGAEDTMFVINGTTGAIHAMLMGTLSPGDKILLPRNAHRSIIGGGILAGAVPVYIGPEVDSRLGIAMGLSLSAVRRAIADHPDARALLAVYPTYYGFCCDLQAIAEAVHEAGMLLLVDEAHGAHLRFSDELPSQAIELGADVAAQSTHKLLGSMTQTSMLHTGSSRVDKKRLRQAAGLLQSTSPNQLLLASLDIARLQMAEEGRRRMAEAVRLSRFVRDEVNRIPGLYSPGTEICHSGKDSGATCLDCTKVTVNLSGLALGGPEAELMLRHRYKIQCELSDTRNLLFIISMADNKEVAERLLAALKDMAASYPSDGGRPKGEECAEAVGSMPRPVQRMNPRDAFFAAVRTVPLEEAAGAVSAETVAFYPPGVPLLCPGEEITAEIISYIRRYQALGLRLSGPADGRLATIRVIQ
ncbi:aminotransferase class I/II-fold pyridoxal phosphate-dependent enzyme [Anaerovibrio sp.]|uniref:aminotransferase class I/II-fold pyridoxal phosphate-dependent enzyme n=1 Tax=Anaerovibrio sp. TaxID=1872532 RepID=UPI003F183C51